MAEDRLLNKILKLEKIIESLRAREKRYELAVQGSHDGLWDVPFINHNAMWWSPRFYELLGYEDGEIEASVENLYRLTSPHDIEKIKQAIRDLIINRTPYHVEHRMRVKSGEFRWFLARCIAIRNKEDKAVRLSGSVQDITYRKKAAEELRIYESILEHMAEAVILIQTSNTSIVYANPRLEELYGYESRELIGKHFSILHAFDPTKFSAFMNEIDDSINSSGKWKGECQNIRKDGSTFWCSITTSPLDHEIFGPVWIIVQEDITAQKDAIEEIRILNENLEQRVLERTEELQKSLDHLRSTKNQLGIQEKQTSLNILTGGIAHELKNPLNLVINLADIASELGAEIQNALESSPKIKSLSQFSRINENLENLNRIAQTIHKHGMRANEIINNVLEHSRKEKPLIDLANVNRLLEKCLSYSTFNIQSDQVLNEQNVNIIVDKALDERIEMIELFPQDISKAFLSILKNAFDALTEKSKNEGENYSPKLKISTENSKDTVVIKIHDNGVGISKNNESQIFDTFFTTKPPGQRIGLGLALSQEIIVKEHGGQLEFRTKEGQFTEFIITLPKKIAL